MSDDSRADAGAQGDPQPSTRPCVPEGRPINVTVFAHGPPLSVSFSHEWQFDGDHRQPGDRIDVPRKRRGDGGTRIRFKLVNQTSPRVNLGFVADENAMWVSRTECPRSNPSFDREIKFIDSDDQNLRVFDHNNEDVLLYYTLRFEPDPRRYYYDPEIKNGGVDT